MAARYDPAAYLYATARIRALESGLVGREKLNALLECKTVDEVVTALAAQGFDKVTREDGSTDTEGMLFAALQKGFAAVTESVPDPGMTALARLPYDGHNIKAVLKCTVRGLDPASMLIDLGTVPADRVIRAVTGADTDLFPRHMGAAISPAKAAYQASGDPRDIDFIVDKACFADLLEAAEGFDFARRYIAARIDLVNVLMCLRLFRMQAGAAGETLLDRALVPGGTWEPTFFKDAYAAGEDGLLTALAATPYAALAGMAGGRAPEAVERAADNCLTGLLHETTFTAFGPEVPFAYLMGLETAVKNVRILLAGKAAGLSADAIRERVRESYV